MNQSQDKKEMTFEQAFTILMIMGNKEDRRLAVEAILNKNQILVQKNKKCPK